MPTPTEYTEEELLTEEERRTLDPNIRAELKSKRALERRVAELESTQSETAKSVAFWRAGVPSDERGTFFARAYDGPLDDPGAIKTKFDELFGDKTPEDPNRQKTAEELAAEKRIADAGGEVVGVPGTISLEDAIKNAKTNEEVMAIIRAAPPEAGLRVSDGE